MEFIYLLSTNQTWLLLTVGLFALLVGSFLNVVIYRLPVILERQWRQECAEWQNETDETQETPTFNLVVPRSQCLACGHQISAWENIPILSYLILRGRCGGCKTPISIQYPLVELTTALLCVLVATQVGFGMPLLALLGFTWALIALAMIDAKTMLLPDVLVYPLLWAGLILNINGLFISLPDAVIGASIGYLSLWSLFHLFRLLTGKEGMGYGDFKLLAALGAWGGWQILPFIIFTASFAGAAFGIGWMLLKRQRESQPMPFGPWLALAGFIAMVWHDTVTQYMTRLFLPL